MKQKIIIIIGVCIVAFATYALIITSNHRSDALYGLSQRSQPNHQFSHRNFQSGKQTTFQDFETPLSKQKTMVGDQPQFLTNSPTQRMAQRTSKHVTRPISQGQIASSRKGSTSILKTLHVATNNSQVMPSSTSLGSSSSNSKTSASQSNSAQNISFASNISALNTLSNGEIYAQYTTANVPVQYAMADNPGGDPTGDPLPLNASTKVLLLFIALYGLVIWRKSEKRETVR